LWVMKTPRSYTSNSPKVQSKTPVQPKTPVHSRASTGREQTNPLDYQHPYSSMADYARLLALSYDCNRTRHAYYRQLRLLHEYFQCDPRLMTEEKGPKGSKFSDSLCDTTSASRPFVI